MKFGAMDTDVSLVNFAIPNPNNAYQYQASILENRMVQNTVRGDPNVSVCNGFHGDIG